MKKVLFAALMMFSSVGAFAQHAVGSFNLQPKIGVSIANLTDMKDSDPRVGLVAGVEGEYHRLAISSQLALVHSILCRVQRAQYQL